MENQLPKRVSGFEGVAGGLKRGGGSTCLCNKTGKAVGLGIGGCFAMTRSTLSLLGI
jgi:hypothetical protein